MLAQVSGQTSEEVLEFLTSRLEAELSTIPEVVNIESTTTGAFGSVLTLLNDFGIDREKLLVDVQAGIDSVWLPLRKIEPADGQDSLAFADGLIGDLSPQVMLYIAGRDSNFLFQLEPEVWAALSPETVASLLSYLASQTEQVDDDKSALQQLVEQELVPQLSALPRIANIQISGGQALPGEAVVSQLAGVNQGAARSVLFQLSPEAWASAASRIAELGLTDLNDSAVQALAAMSVPSVEGIPALPESWLRPGFKDASDLLEVRTLTVNAAGVINSLHNKGRIVGSLGKTDDLTPEVVSQLLEIAPSIVNYLDAEHLAAMPQEIFELLPEDYIAGLDGFTRDALAAKALATQISGTEAQVEPVLLPSQWRPTAPQMLTFSFADLPLATYSVYAPLAMGQDETPTDTEATDAADSTVDTQDTTDSSTSGASQPTVEIPEGPALPLPFGLLGAALGLEINTADDLIGLELPEEMAAQFGASTLRAADLFNFLLLLDNPDQLPEGTPAIPISLDVLFGGVSADAFTFLAENDPTFIPNVGAEVYDYLSDTVLQTSAAKPPLADVWNALSNQPQFAETPIESAADVLAIGQGSASTVLNTINTAIPAQFAGYEVRLFDSLTPGVLRYWALNETEFFEALDQEVVRKFSAASLAVLPETALTGKDSAVIDEVAAIVAGTAPSAYDTLKERYALDVPPADPDAPLLNTDWEFIADFLGLELDSADDFFRFFPDATVFLNDFFNSAQGASFAPNLFGNMTAEMWAYMNGRDPLLLNNLRIEALQLIPADVMATLPAQVQERAASGGAVFVPTSTITRNNGASSLLVTIFKEGEANTVQAYYDAKAVIESIQANNPQIVVTTAFEQSSFIEESISGVAREGITGALFAMIVILLFLSGGRWDRSPRRVVGSVLFGGFVAVFFIVLLTQAQNSGASLTQAWEQVDVVVRVLLIVGVVAGLIILVLPLDLPVPAWRATLVIGVSLPLSVFAAFALMHWLPPLVNSVLTPIAGDSAFLKFVLRLFPESLTLNIMTLSGLTVAVGRIVDDSIVVLENAFREIQNGGDKRKAVLKGTADVSSAIFVATLVTVVVFLPLGLTGGLIGEFFLPFGLAVTYSLAASFVVAITVVPVLMLMFIGVHDASEEEAGIMNRVYDRTLKWALRSGGTKWTVLGIAGVTMVFGFALFGTRPAAFLPDFGELQIDVSVQLPQGTKIIETDERVRELEDAIRRIMPEEELKSIRTVIGGGGLNLDALLGGGSVTENRANVVVTAEGSKSELAIRAEEINTEATLIFGEDNVSVAVASLSSGGFGGFEIVVFGPQEDLERMDAAIIAAIDSVEGIDNVTSNLSTAAIAGPEAPRTYLRVDGSPALNYSAELKTDNTIGVTTQAIEAVQSIPDFPDSLTAGQGYESEIQTAGFAGLFVAMGIAILIVVVILVVSLKSPVYWLAIILSVVVAPVGAAVALTVTDRVLGISALIGMLMLIGIVITNAVVLIDRVRQNMAAGHSLYESLVEAGERRLRPILMTALATIIALIPLAVGLSEGALIASELGTVVIGGLLSSTVLTLLVVPVAYSLLTPLHRMLTGQRKAK
ncbi:MAG: efflux RND transporter permease subunit [Chloroflexi bacterium]|nr:efflux RND transporter permease subunit [Chloroflexota bacterium]